MKSKVKIDKLAHKYALDISKFHKIVKAKKIDFADLNKDFYGDIEKNNILIKSDKKLLDKIKGITLKEFIYTNKNIPDLWKNKLNYQYEMANLISKDKKLLSYIGSFPFEYGYKEKLPKIKTNITNEIITDKTRKTLRIKKTNEMNDDDLNVIMDNYKVVYPIKEKLENLINIYNEENSKINNIINETNEDNFSNTKESNFYSYIKVVNTLNKTKNEKLRKQNSFRQNIFTLDSLKKKDDNEYSQTKTILINNKKFKRNIFFKKKNETRNKIIEDNVKTINYYGPHFSFCPSCKDKNIEFYNNMEPNQCLELINHIKNMRKINSIYKPKKIIKIKRSSSVQGTNSLNERESEESEYDENIN